MVLFVWFYLLFIGVVKLGLIFFKFKVKKGIDIVVVVMMFVIVFMLIKELVFSYFF